MSIRPNTTIMEMIYPKDYEKKAEAEKPAVTDAQIDLLIDAEVENLTKPEYLKEVCDKVQAQLHKTSVHVMDEVVMARVKAYAEVQAKANAEAVEVIA